MNNLPIILSILPFAFFLFLLLIKKTSLLKASFLTLVLYSVLAVFFWQIMPSYLYISYMKGFFIAFDILIIIFGAIFFLEILEDLKIIKNISYYLENFSKDYRIQIIIIAWFFSSFLEGTAGFGTPAAIAVPLLVGIGLGPIKALIVGLIGNSAAGVFGAAGTPIRVGFAGLNTASVPLTAALLNCVGFIVPIFMLWTITAGRVNRKKEFLDALPFAIWSGFAFVIPSVFLTYIGQEFPSILGSLIGLILIIISTKLKIFTPKEEVRLCEEKEITHTMSKFKSFLPYGILIFFLILGKIFLGKTGIPFNIGFNHVFNVFNPGFAFVSAGIVVMLIWKTKKVVFFDSINTGIRNAIPPFLVIVSMSAMVQVIINSGHNISDIPSAVDIIAKGFESRFLPLFTPFVGAFGAFMTGSVTISNIMFGNFFATAAQNIGFNVASILSLSVVGAAAGNMIALADILTAEAVLHVKNKEREILKGVIVPCLVYLALLGLIGIFVF